MINYSDYSFPYEFGIYYFTKGINLINNQMLENNIKELKGKIKDLFGILELTSKEEKQKKIQEIKLKYKFDN